MKGTSRNKPKGSVDTGTRFVDRSLPNISLGISNSKLRKQREVGRKRRKWLMENAHKYTREEAATELGVSVKSMSEYASRYGYKFKSADVSARTENAGKARQERAKSKRGKLYDWILRNYETCTIGRAVRELGVAAKTINKCEQELGVRFIREFPNNGGARKKRPVLPGPIAD